MMMIILIIIITTTTIVIIIIIIIMLKAHRLLKGSAHCTSKPTALRKDLITMISLSLVSKSHGWCISRGDLILTRHAMVQQPGALPAVVW